jgi:hypothetical protein
MLSRMTISIRHFSTPILLMILLLAPVPRAIARLRESGWRAARVIGVAYVLLSIVSVVTVIRAYPYYFPFLNSFSFGRPGYALATDSNLDWNQALPEVNEYAEQHGLNDVLVDEYGLNDPTVYVPRARFWNCQEPQPSDGGHWAVVSGDMIEDAHNCVWLLQFPHQELAGGRSAHGVRVPRIWHAYARLFRRALDFLELHSGPKPTATHDRQNDRGIHGRACQTRGAKRQALTLG